ncbi:MAG: ABC transporter ATP-binding protein [Erysipelotrichales bacterium]|nr:ABC transporter ATP-binding protein [Erysipelotrichales bacterium]
MSELTALKEEEFKDESLDTKLWREILHLLKPQKNRMIAVCGIMVVLALCDACYPIFSRIAVDHFIIGEGSDAELGWFIAAFIGIIVVQGVSVYIMIALSGKIETGFSYHVRTKMFEKLQLLSFSYYDKNPVGWIMSRITSDVARLSEILAWSLSDIFWGLTTMVFITVVMVVTDWKLALIVLATVPVLAVIANWFEKRILRNYREVRKTNSILTGAFSEGIEGAKTSKTLVLEEANTRAFAGMSKDMRVKSVRAGTISAFMMPIVTTLSYIAIGALLWYGGGKVLIGAMKFGTLLMFSQYAQSFFDPLRSIAGLLAEMQMAQAAGERVLSLLREEPGITDTGEVIEKFGGILEPVKEGAPAMKGDVEFCDVTFRYIPEETVLDHFSLKVDAGTTLALVGETGSGKSTIVNLLCRFYEPVSGSIRIDGKDYREYSVGWLHEHLGYVLQTPFLFSGTVADNIRYGKPEATMEEVRQAAELVHADTFINRLEKGYDTEVGEGGNRLSTGEKQLISFARAVLKDPKLLVLDEATSSVDTEAEKKIQDALEVLMKGRTSFVVAHRLSTIVNADHILVMKDGKILEEGTHSSLMKKKGYYHKLYTNRFIEEENRKIMAKKETMSL